ncbi:CoA ester lyase [Haliea sp. E1-2-M8]|uniref:HpcH/HpaI aldolase/citrate lyase family protein n=1 Tax=Haliea sp. E1-2-M8 TaxID=3064706 RepID=UPI00271D2114|nr:CoA ester lyase [Haliea sp. E1-2-M8]MDO8864098.1 CoA ester lyase [Haliea sp. E1-2-M8]
MSTASRPVWRSMLFVPAHVEKFVAKAHTRGADACILDLEDSVPLEMKAEARQRIESAARAINEASNGVLGVLVRINNDSEQAAAAPLLEADLASAVRPGVAALVIPKVKDAGILHRIATRLDAIEAEAGVGSGSTQLIAQIEDVQALPVIDAIAQSSVRMLGMSLGSEDFSASAGMQPTPEALYQPNQMVVFACRRANILPFGFPSSIAEYSDEEAFAASVKRAAEMGFVGAFCIHPKQAAMLNTGFSPSAAEIAAAKALMTAVAEAERESRGAFAHNGKMVDPPVIRRAQEVLCRAASLPTVSE